MSTTITEDILTVKKGIIIQQANCAGTIPYGSQLWQLAMKYPQVQRHYQKAIETKSQDELFGIGVIVTLDKHLQLVMLFSQRDYDTVNKSNICYTDIEKLVDGIKRAIKKFPDDTIYVPWEIGCGRTGGNWKKIQPLLDSLNVTLVKPPELEQS